MKTEFIEHTPMFEFPVPVKSDDSQLDAIIHASLAWDLVQLIALSLDLSEDTIWESMQVERKRRMLHPCGPQSDMYSYYVKKERRSINENPSIFLVED